MCPMNPEHALFLLLHFIALSTPLYVALYSSDCEHTSLRYTVLIGLSLSSLGALLSLALWAYAFPCEVSLPLKVDVL